ncbi:hypothetical protein [Aeromonas veronii]|uniref:hypothetical protein n=1 Tax=Aeromonas veronii TaxID=654 RepID=UPI003B9ED590
MKTPRIVVCIALIFTVESTAAVISTDRQKIEETLSLNATVNLSDEALLGAVDIKVLSPLTENAVWNNSTQQFNDLGVFVHVERQTPSPLQVSVMNDNYQCTYRERMVSRSINAKYLSDVDYKYSVRSTGRSFIGGTYRVEAADWQLIDQNKVMVGLDINIRLPQFNKANFHELSSHEGHCAGQVQLLFTLAN